MEKGVLEERRTDTVRRILDAGTVVFADAGFAGARMDEIARRAGVNKAMIYYHIGDKKALYAKVLHDVFADAAQRMARSIKKAKTPEEKFRAYIRNVEKTVNQHPQVPQIILREVASGGRHFPDVVAKDILSILEGLTSILEAGVEQGIFMETNPLIVHLMALGPIMFLKRMNAMKEKFEPLLPRKIKKFEKTLLSNTTEQIEHLLLKTLKK